MNSEYLSEFRLPSLIDWFILPLVIKCCAPTLPFHYGSYKKKSRQIRVEMLVFMGGVRPFYILSPDRMLCHIFQAEKSSKSCVIAAKSVTGLAKVKYN